MARTRSTKAATQADVTTPDESPVEVTVAGVTGVLDDTATPDEVTPEVTPDEATPESTPVVRPVIRPENEGLILAAYRDGDKSMKAKIRKAFQIAIGEAVMVKSDVDLAKALMAIQEKLSAAPAKSAEKIDVNRVLAERVMALRTAADLIMSGTLPEGIDASDVNEEALAQYVVDMTDSEDVVASVIESAQKIASAKITRSADRRDIGEYMIRAFDGLATGTYLTVAQIITRGAIDGDDYRPTSGAVSARLNAPNGCTVPGIEKAVNGSGTLGARNV